MQRRIKIIGRKTEVRCRICSQRLFDHISGEYRIEIKCSRCGNVNVLHGRMITTVSAGNLPFAVGLAPEAGKN